MPRATAAEVQHPRVRRRGRRARLGILLEGREEGVNRLFREVRSELAWVRRGLGQVREGDLRRTAACERRLAHEALVEDAAERVEVALPRRLRAFDQLRGEVVRGAEDLALRGQAGGVSRAREAEVGERGRTLAVEQDVRGFDVAVEDVLAVQRVEPARELRGEFDQVVGSE